MGNQTHYSEFLGDDGYREPEPERKPWLEPGCMHCMAPEDHAKYGDRCIMEDADASVMNMAEGPVDLPTDADILEHKESFVGY